MKIKKKNSKIINSGKIMALKLNNFSSKAKNFKKKISLAKLINFIQKKPFTSFFSVLAILLIFMVLGNLLFGPKNINKIELIAAKKVQVYSLSKAPQVIYQGKVEKTGVVKMVAQMPGIVSRINVSEGQQVFRGTNILSLSSNYQGGNSLSISRQITQNQYNNAKDTFDTQKELIQKQKEVADKNKENTEKLRDIAGQTASDTQNVANMNQSMVDSLNQTLQTLINTNVGEANDAAIAQTKSSILQLQSSLLQLNSSLRNLNYQSSGDKPPANLANLQYDITVKQLNIQEKALATGLEAARLQYNLALVSEANMYPSSPIGGTVDRIYVKLGDTVSPGMPLALISGNNQHVKVTVNVPKDIAKNISPVESSVLIIGGKEVKMRHSYSSLDATNGTLHTVIYQLDDSVAADVTDSSFVTVKIPVGVANQDNTDPYIPLDAVIQTQEESFVYIVGKNNIAKSQKIELGEIEGRYVKVISGLPKNSEIILDRNIIEGDKIEVIR